MKLRLLSICLIFLLVACGPATRDQPVPTSMPTIEGPTPTTQAVGRQPTIENTLRIAEPLPGTELTDSVTIKGEGRAYENTIQVKLDAGGKTLVEDFVTTTANTGEIGEFTITLHFQPVDAPTDGEVVIYTTSAKDGSVDQEASVPVKLVPKR